MYSESISVLLVEDNAADARLVREMLVDVGNAAYDLQVTDCLSNALELIVQCHLDILLLDLSLPDSVGLSSIAEIQTRAPDLPIIVLSGLNDEQIALDAVHNGAQDYLVKGENNGALLSRSMRYAIERKRSEQRLAYLAQYDSLTDLPNRLLFRDRLEQALKHAQRKSLFVGLMFLDLDHFKDINDTLGHEIGDKLLTSAANRIQQCVREEDTVARLGGDEFTVIVSGIDDIKDVKSVAEKINRSIAEPFSIDGKAVYVSTSIGISIYPENGENADTLTKNADMALYAAKDKGRSTYQLFESKMKTEVARRLALVTQLRQAMKRDEFVLHYQPQYDVLTSELVGMEALLRWQNPKLGIVEPAVFVPLLEETGLIIEVGEWVIRSACKQQREWLKAGHKPLRIAVNLSARQFRQRNLVMLVKEILNETAMDPEYLQLEITESALIVDSDHNLDILSGLHQLGIKLSIDDFGTGFSSLSYLRLFPFDALKVDRSFVKTITIDPNGAAIVGAVIALAHSLQLRIVAEGVELGKELDFLQQQGCDEVQGFLFATPLTVENCYNLFNDSITGKPLSTYASAS